MNEPLEILYSDQAARDMDSVYEYIAHELLSPDTAVSYFNGILDIIDELKITGNMLAYSQNTFLTSQYGADIRTITYKKMTIIYKVIQQYVIILRVMAGSLIR